jgi:HAE1 family hydrophobic/amphiphilic exporter-1
VERESDAAGGRAVALASVTAPQGVSLDYTTAKMREIEDASSRCEPRARCANVFLIRGQRRAGETGASWC